MNEWKGLSIRYVSEVDFEATSEDEMSFKASERFQLFWVSGNRWMVLNLDENRENVKRIGYVPARCLVKEKPVEEQPWYLEVDRNEAMKLLLTAPNRVGSFLVRPSLYTLSGYALSVRRDDGVSHFNIKWDQEQQFSVGGFPSCLCVHDLIIYLRQYWMVRSQLRMVPYIKVASIEDSWEKPWSDFSLIKKLRAGEISTVFKGKWIGGDRIVLIQSIDKEIFKRQEFMEGINIFKRLNHKNIITLCALCTSEDPVYIVTEYLPKGNLQSFLRGEEGPFLTDLQLMHIASQVLDGLAYLEVKNVVHCGLSCHHVIVGNNLICKISHLEYARMIKNSTTFINTQSKYLLKWLPPECHYYGELSRKTCVWSFGIFLYEIFTLGQTPYSGQSISQVLLNLEAGYRLPMPPLCSAHIYSLMRECWEIKPRNRPSFQQIAEKKLFEELP
ncbi:tyrosine-protein kinase Srms-like [Dendropsophus ebraccatus]|uniref:tyrosine-protein kinase Srms-like n=1 Tax=Dendropsophus ebraccatus TaxID=150705 RepID=UPI0038319EEE